MKAASRYLEVVVDSAMKNQSIGLAFNVRDENNFDFAMLRYYNSSCTEVYKGYIEGGEHKGIEKVSFAVSRLHITTTTLVLFCSVRAVM